MNPPVQQDKLFSVKDSLLEHIDLNRMTKHLGDVQPLNSRYLTTVADMFTMPHEEYVKKKSSAATASEQD
jgi:hypothetical protein